MPSRTKHNDSALVSLKASRIAQRAKSTSLPVGRTFSMRGKTASDNYHTFSFAVLSASQQMKQRNGAYRFFSID